MTKYRDLSVETRLRLAKVESVLATGSKLEKLVLFCSPIETVRLLWVGRVWNLPRCWWLILDSFLHNFRIAKAILEGRI